MAAGCGAWVLADRRQETSFPLGGPLLRLLECPHYLAADFLPSGRSQREEQDKQEASGLFMTQSDRQNFVMALDSARGAHALCNTLLLSVSRT